MLRRLLGICFSLVVFLGSQVLAWHGCPGRKGLLDTHHIQEHIQGSDKSCWEESWMTLPPMLFIRPKYHRQGRFSKSPRAPVDNVGVGVETAGQWSLSLLTSGRTHKAH